jgi:hypothetical protein
MSIPDRLWRVVRGHWIVAGDRIRELEAQAAAYKELSEALRGSAGETEHPALESATEPRTGPLRASGGRDALQASYELLGLSPGVTLEQATAAFERQRDALAIETLPEGSPDRRAAQARISALEAAYDRIRDVLHPTETRFERLEF